MKKHLVGIVIVLASWTVTTIILALSYGLVQQVYRQNANDPQIQLASDGAAALAAGDPADTLVADSDVDLRSSLAPAVIIFDDNKQVVVASAKVNGKVPTIPPGVLEQAKLHGRNIVTWQPASDVRLAAVAVRSGGEAPGYVVAVRSLKEVEVREAAALNLVALGWLISTLTIFGAWAAVLLSQKRTHRGT